MHASTRLTLIIVLLSVSTLFFIGGPTDFSPRSFNAFWNLGHILFFALFTVALLQGRKPGFGPGWQIVFAATLTFILGLAIELLQGGFNRTPDIEDLARNMIGVMVALFFILPLRHALPRRSVLLLQAATLILIGFQLVPGMTAVFDEYLAHRQFPVLSGFETPFEIGRWEGEAMVIDHHIKHTGNASLRVTLNTDLYSGVGLTHFPADWDTYNAFQFSLFNPSAEGIRITCRIHDRTHVTGIQTYEDRFNRSFHLENGWNTVTIRLNEVRQAPLNRQMDMHRIHGLGIFATRLPHPRTIYIDDVRLIR